MRTCQVTWGWWRLSFNTMERTPFFCIHSCNAKQTLLYINKTSIVMRPWQTNCDKKCEDNLATIILNSWFMFDTFDIKCRSEISTTKYYFNACNGPKTKCMACVWPKTHRDTFEHTYNRIYINIIFYASALTHYLCTCTAKSLAYTCSS